MIQSSGTELEIKVRDIQFRYNEAGNRKNPTIIFIHGFPFNKTMWDPQLSALSESFRCIAYDLPGFGSTPAYEEFSIEKFDKTIDDRL